MHTQPAEPSTATSYRNENIGRQGSVRQAAEFLKRKVPQCHRAAARRTLLMIANRQRSWHLGTNRFHPTQAGGPTAQSHPIVGSCLC